MQYTNFIDDFYLCVRFISFVSLWSQLAQHEQCSNKQLQMKALKKGYFATKILQENYKILQNDTLFVSLN